jgi:hypothetical protein
LLLICNIAITEQKNSNQQETRIIISLSTIVVMFFALETPSTLAWFYSKNAVVVTNITFMVNHACNFITYFVVNSQYRQEVWNMLGCKAASTQTENKTSMSDLSVTEASKTNTEKY